jgi:RNA polymerase sigma-70 factor, ECF subfamily
LARKRINPPDKCCKIFRRASGALSELLQADVELEIPPLPIWFAGRDLVILLLAARTLTKSGDVVVIPTAANAQPAVTGYRRGCRSREAGPFRTGLTTRAGGIAAIAVFLDPRLFRTFGLPRPGKLAGSEATAYAGNCPNLEPPEFLVSSLGLAPTAAVDRSLPRLDH